VVATSRSDTFTGGRGPQRAGGTSMRKRGWFLLFLLFLPILLALIFYLTFIRQIPCGTDLFGDQGNGSFESGNFVPTTEGVMDLPDASTDLTGWTVAVDSHSNNRLRWAQNVNRFGVMTKYGERFLSLIGSNLSEPYPALIRVSVPVQRGRYELGFSLGQDKQQGLPGSVSADADVSGAATRHQTFSTAAAGDNWQPFTMDFDVTADGSVRITFSATSKQGPVRYVGLDNVSLRRFMTLSQCLTGQ